MAQSIEKQVKKTIKKEVKKRQQKSDFKIVLEQYKALKESGMINQKGYGLAPLDTVGREVHCAREQAKKFD